MFTYELCKNQNKKA